MTSVSNGPSAAYDGLRLLDSSRVKPQKLSTDDVQEALAEMEAQKAAHDSRDLPASAAAEVATLQAQLQKASQAETEFRTQQIAQEGDAVVSAGDDDEEQSEAVKAFLDYMSKTPEERYFESFLKSKGMTKEEFEALPPEEKQALLKEFQEMVRERTEAESAKKLARTAASELL